MSINEQNKLIQQVGGHARLYDLASTTTDQTLLTKMVAHIPDIYLANLAENPNLTQTQITSLIKQTPNINWWSLGEALLANPATNLKTSKKILQRHPQLINTIPHRADYTADYLQFLAETIPTQDETRNWAYNKGLACVLTHPNTSEQTLRYVMKKWKLQGETAAYLASHDNTTSGMLLHLTKTLDRGGSAHTAIINNPKTPPEAINILWNLDNLAAPTRKFLLENQTWLPDKAIPDMFNTPNIDTGYVTLIKNHIHYKTKLLELLTKNYDDVSPGLPTEWLEELAKTIITGKPRSILTSFGV